MHNVICMKWGTAYSADDVNMLYRMVGRNLSRPHRFVCFTDDPAGLETGIEHFPLPAVRVPEHLQHEAWYKLGTFSYPLADLEGEALFLDLDIIIVDSIDCFFEHPGEFCIIHNWTHPDRIVGNSWSIVFGSVPTRIFCSVTMKTRWRPETSIVTNRPFSPISSAPIV
ncbi:MAG: hypothetical protein U5P41_01650 [Gammaproteobacteria bacterium]|nr:hypothetical protein [Gammaproteobacteria bacterium]